MTLIFIEQTGNYATFICHQKKFFAVNTEHKDKIAVTWQGEEMKTACGLAQKYIPLYQCIYQGKSDTI